MNLYDIVNEYKSDVNVLMFGLHATFCFNFETMERDYQNSTYMNGARIEDSLTFNFHKEGDEWIQFKDHEDGYFLSIHKKEVALGYPLFCEKSILKC